MHRGLAHVLAGALILSATPLATAVLDTRVGGAVTNSGFELRVAPDGLGAALADTPADRCYGVGHQVLYGSETPLGEATGGGFGSPDAGAADPLGAASSVIANPNGTVDQQTGCFLNADDGFDVFFAHPRKDLTRPVGWSVDKRNQAVAFGTTFDEDPSDREVKILADETTSNRNLWQRFDSRHQAFTPNAEALELNVETGTISDQAMVRLELEPTDAAAHQDTAMRECMLTFEATQLQDRLAEGTAGHLAADPANATFEARNPSCDALEAAWNDASDDTDRRSVLAQTRIVELGFWRWNWETTTPTVIDDVRLPGASLVAEEIAAGNVTVS